jgi:flagellar basal-body rod modification protein FlgD
MAINPVSGSQTATTSSATADSTPLGKTLNQHDFLKLLVAQMTSQDPMNPQSNADFAAQMAQFSALQTSQSTASELAKLSANQQVQQANGLLGRTVTVQSDESIASGTVDAVQLSGGIPLLLVNGAQYDLSQVLSIQPTLTPQ